MKQIVECVPNISEGRDRSIIDACANAAAEVDGVTLLDVDPGADTNRTVITLAGEPDAVLEGAFRLIEASSRLIDMRKHKGEHPRAGAADVCPFVPVSGISMEECAELARRLGRRVGEELELPVYLYGFAASKPEWRLLPNVRKGEYEALPQKMKDPAWKPDFGPHKFVPHFGAVHISARKFLIAYNINLNTRSARHAKDIALLIRDSGHVLRDSKRRIVRGPDGKPAKKLPGLFDKCKAAGWYLDDFKQAQVTMNLTDPDVTLAHEVFEKVRDLAREQGTRVTGSEIVGLVPLEAMLEAGRYYLRRQERSTAVPERELVRVAIESMGLEDVNPFEMDKKVVEYAIAAQEKRDDLLVDMTISGFADELASDSPAPGGGSVAAVVGALGAGLATMVSNLTHGKYEYHEHWEAAERIGVRGQELKARLLKAVDDDTDSFNAVMAANRLPATTDEEKQEKEKAVEEANKLATRIPYSVCEMSMEVFDLADEMIEKGNPNSVSDAGVAALCAMAAVHGAALNVQINLPGVTDEAFIREMTEGIARMREESVARNDKAQERVQAVLKGGRKAQSPDEE